MAIVISIGFSSCDSKNNQKSDKKDTLATKQEEKKIEIDKESTFKAQVMGGVEVTVKGYDSLYNQEFVKQHYKVFSEQWQKLEDSRLSKMRPWRDTELAKVNKEQHNLFYPFSGPDFLNAYEFFPNCDNYLMFGLEPIGSLPDLKNFNVGYLGSIRNALSVIFQRNYFITSYMGSDLAGKGVVPIISLFLVRTGNEIVSIQKVTLNKDGSYKLIPFSQDPGKDVLTGLCIEFLNKNKKKSQKIFYFGTDIEDPAMAKKEDLANFIRSFPNKIAFVKSASYTMHGGNFSIVRNLLLEGCSLVLQDDTGVRYEVFTELGWDVQLYGKYARPVADFAAYTYQPKLAEAYQTQKDKIKTLSFTYGYHWSTDLASVLIATKNANSKSPQDLQDNKKVEKKEDKKVEAKADTKEKK
jgi:hypothetical protein